MAYRKKIYVSFDADDVLYYNMLQAWCTSDAQELIHYSLKISEYTSQRIADNAAKSIEEKIATTSCLIVLVSDHTLSLGSQMKQEIDSAIKLNMPIIVANLNGKRSIDKDLCPANLQSHMALHLSFNAKIIQKAIDTWPIYYDQNKDDKTGAFFFKQEVYQTLGL